MREFNLDLLIGKKVVVNCKTKNEAEVFLQYLDDKNIKWSGSINIFKNNNYTYNYYKSEIHQLGLYNFVLIEYRF